MTMKNVITNTLTFYEKIYSPLLKLKIDRFYLYYREINCEILC